MNSSYYKYCLVPQCKSTTIKNDKQKFIYVPNNEQIRKKLLKLARRDDVHSLSTNSRMYFCADHFDVRRHSSSCGIDSVSPNASAFRKYPPTLQKHGLRIFETAVAKGRKKTSEDLELQYSVPPHYAILTNITVAISVHPAVIAKTCPPLTNGFLPRADTPSPAAFMASP
ncbi:hypothetical protein NQ317_006410 [Molorchus minor]|uniref:THAP-type domain-containing protein n=1 Tax=Molorchus minor TaxID=1323400 RepID=A0ABQ9IWC3_9CUCU|nr:hypothetical protein NQ317_006410 [Molorchus minor]